MAEDSGDQEPKAPGPPMFRGKTYSEWIDDALAMAAYDPLEFIGKSQDEVKKILDKNQGLYMALLEIDALFGAKDARKALYAIASKRYTQQATVQLRVPAPGGRATLDLQDGQNGEVGQLMDALLRGDKKLPTTFVPSSVVSSEIAKQQKPRFT